MSNKSVKILVLQGGESTEREVSLRSAAAVAAALHTAGYEVSTYDPIDGDKGLAMTVAQADVVLPILHGDNGEDGVIQAKLEQLGAKYLGSSSKVSRLCIDKVKMHEALATAGILMPRYETVTGATIAASELYLAPFVLKTIDGGSSVDLYISRDPTHIDEVRVQALLNKRGMMLIEELIDGQEITVGVLDRRALPIVAILPPPDGEFDYENKYNGKSQEVCPVPFEMLSESLQQESQALALNVHETLGARHLSRTDMIVTPNGKVYVLELNTIPGLTDQSLFPKEAAAAGMTMVELVKQFVALVENEE